MRKNAKIKYIKKEAEAEKRRKVCNDENLNLNFVPQYANCRI